MSANFVATMRRRWVLTLMVVAAFALLVLLGVGMTRDPRELPSVLIGKPWPEMSLPKMNSAAADGDPVGPAELRGKARLVNVWASWCSVCVEEHPVMLELSKILRAQGRSDQLIGINFKDDPDDANAWLRQYKNPFGFILVDAKGRMGIELGVYGAPETYLVDENGIIVWKHVGALTPALVIKEVLPRLGVTT
jgi:cytochrome c biogenesis protein CcmG/thiol:disulfide interchange protein DsbE